LINKLLKAKSVIKKKLKNTGFFVVDFSFENDLSALAIVQGRI
jgi:hypothetical protein